MLALLCGEIGFCLVLAVGGLMGGDGGDRYGYGCKNKFWWELQKDYI